MMKMKYVSFLLLPLVNSYVISQEPQAPISDDWEVVGDALGAGVGIHFTASYATAAIRCTNGTIEEVGKIEGSSQYVDLIAKWAHRTSPKQCIHKLEDLMSFPCYVAHKIRQLRKWFGLPGTSDVGTLSSLLINTKDVVESKLGAPINYVWPVFPYLPGMDVDDITDAFEYAGLSYFPKMFQNSIYWETTGSYVGSGYGLCKSFANETRCEEELHPLQPQRVLFFNFDNSSFSAGSLSMRTPWRDWPDAYTLDVNLGWWNLPVDEIPRAKFWARIHEVIVDMMHEGRNGDRAPNKIILLGEHAADKEFKETVKAALWEVLEYDVDMLLQANKGINGTMVAARGAAELAFRAGFKMRGDMTQEEEEEEVKVMIEDEDGEL